MKNHENLIAKLPQAVSLAEREALALDFLSEWEDGANPAAPLYARLRALVDALQIALSVPEFKSAVMDEIEGLPPEQRLFNGALFEVRNLPAKYDFSSVEEWNDVKAQEKDLATLRKDIEKQLKAEYEANARRLTVGGEIIEQRIKKIEAGVTLAVKLQK